jgi:hypothetical protein
MTEQDGEAIIGPAKIPMTGSRGQPLKIAQYLAEGKRLADVVAAHRATKGEASAEGAPLTQTRTPVQDCNKPTKSKKSYPLPLLPGPTEIPGFPLNPSPPAEAPDYGNMSRVQAIRATQAERRGKRAPLTPSGPSELRKRHDVRTWKVAE